MTRPGWRHVVWLGLLLGAAGCKEDRCTGLSPRVEVTYTLGFPLASAVDRFKLEIVYPGDYAIVARELTLSEAGYAEGRGRFVLLLDRWRVQDDDAISLRMSALSSAGKVLGRGRPADDPVSLRANGCNFTLLHIIAAPLDGGPGDAKGTGPG